MAILPKACKPDNLNRTTLVDCESFLNSNYLDILALCVRQIWMAQLILAISL